MTLDQIGEYLVHLDQEKKRLEAGLDDSKIQRKIAPLTEAQKQNLAKRELTRLVLRSDEKEQFSNI